MSAKTEIERKYIIEMPDISLIKKMPSYSCSKICQIYLECDENITSRIRKRSFTDKTVYTKTAKKRISEIASLENECEICADEFEKLKTRIKHGTSPVIKERHVFTYLGKLFEIDIYPGWKRHAILETELAFYEEKIDFPEFIKIKREVSGIKEYTNAAMSVSFPKEDIY